EGPAFELLGQRKSIVDATLDDRPLRGHDGPGVLAERLITAVAPVTQEIARRSPSTTELVLKRLVAGGRREEIFVTKADLRKKIAGLSPAQRSLFDPLGFGDDAVPASHARPTGSVPPHRAEPAGVEPPTLVMAPRPKPVTVTAAADPNHDQHVIDLNSPRAQDE